MRIFIYAIDAYQLLARPLMPRCCRFEPTCSDYAKEALKLRGWRALPLAAARLLRCHPFHPGGFDPVPR